MYSSVLVVASAVFGLVAALPAGPLEPRGGLQCTKIPTGVGLCGVSKFAQSSSATSSATMLVYQPAGGEDQCVKDCLRDKDCDHVEWSAPTCAVRSTSAGITFVTDTTGSTRHYDRKCYNLADYCQMSNADYDVIQGIPNLVYPWFIRENDLNTVSGFQSQPSTGLGFSPNPSGARFIPDKIVGKTSHQISQGFVLQQGMGLGMSFAYNFKSYSPGSIDAAGKYNLFARYCDQKFAVATLDHTQANNVWKNANIVLENPPTCGPSGHYFSIIVEVDSTSGQGDYSALFGFDKVQVQGLL